MNSAEETFQFHPNDENLDMEPNRESYSKFPSERSVSGTKVIDDHKTEINSDKNDDAISDAAGGNLRGGNDSGSRASRFPSKPPDDFCRDYLFYTCDRRDCKFKHPSKDSEEYKDALATRPNWGNKDRSRSPRRSRSRRSCERNDAGGTEDFRQDKMICRDFLRNNCYRGKDCRYYHPPDGGNDELPWPQLCLDYRTGNCKRADCRFLHFSIDDEEQYMRTGTVSKQLCQHFAEIALKTEILKGRPICKNYMRFNSCSMKVCSYRHMTRPEFEDEMYVLMCQMVYEKCRKFNHEAPLPPADRRDVPPPRPEVGMPPQQRFERDFPPPPQNNPYGRVCPPADGGGDIRLQLEDLKQENMDLRRMMCEDNARARSDVDALKNDNMRLQDNLNFLNNSNQSQQTVKLRQENQELNKKLASADNWVSELQTKYGSVQSECTLLSDNMKKMRMELDQMREEKQKLQKQCADLSAKVKAGAGDNLNTQKKVYLENKFKSMYETMQTCDKEFLETLNNTFMITSPQVMSYFPTWRYLLSDIGEIVSQISTDSAPSKPLSSTPGEFEAASRSYSSVTSPPAGTNGSFVSYAGSTGGGGHYNQSGGFPGVPPPSDRYDGYSGAGGMGAPWKGRMQ